MTLLEFLLARADDLEQNGDEADAKSIREVVAAFTDAGKNFNWIIASDDAREADSTYGRIGRALARRWSDHPDFRSDWLRA